MRKWENTVKPKSALSKNSLLFIFFLYGLTLTSLQIVYLRFFISIFYGNELTIGLFFFSWLLWTATGSLIFGKIKEVLDYLTTHHFLFGLFIPFTLLLMLFIRSQFLPVGSALPDLSLTIFTALFSLIVFGLLSGGLFPLYTRLLNQITSQQPDSAGSRVYLWETSGSLIGGLLCGLLLIRLFTINQIVVGFAILQFVFSFYFLSKTNKPHKSLIIFLYFLIGFFALSSFLSSFDQRFKGLWQGMTIVTQRGSPYGELVLTRLDNSYTLYQDGVPLFTLPDPQTAEETVHYALLLHKNPEKVLLIGGGFSGALFEVLKHPSLQQLHYVELDPEVIELYKEFFPENWQSLIRDGRISIHQTDGRTFLTQTKQQFDVIILALPDPYTVQLNRFYSREFFTLCKNRLKADGILAFQLSAAENYLNQAQASYLKAIEQSFAPLFKNWAFLPGDKLQLFLTNSATPLPLNADSLIKRLHERQLQTLFVQDYYIPFKLMPDRIKLFKDAFQNTTFPFYNSDYRPLAYYFDTILWASKTSTVVARFFNSLFYVSFKYVLFAFFLPFLLILIGVLHQNRNEPAKVLAVSGMFSVGFTIISLELLILIAFQVAHGYLYQQIAIFIALFMGGMAGGSQLAIKVLENAAHLLKKLIGFTILLLVLLSFVTSFWLPFIGSLTFSKTAFYLLAIFCGFSGGFAFPLFNRLYLQTRPDQKRIGVVYAYDLFGSLLGSLLSSIILIPIYGLSATGLFLAILNLVVLVFLSFGFWTTNS